MYPYDIRSTIGTKLLIKFHASPLSKFLGPFTPDGSLPKDYWRIPQIRFKCDLSNLPARLRDIRPFTQLPSLSVHSVIKSQMKRIPAGKPVRIYNMARVSVHMAGYNNTSSTYCLIFALIDHITYDLLHLFNLHTFMISLLRKTLPKRLSGDLSTHLHRQLS